MCLRRQTHRSLYGTTLTLFRFLPHKVPKISKAFAFLQPASNLKYPLRLKYNIVHSIVIVAMNLFKIYRLLYQIIPKSKLTTANFIGVKR